MTVEEAVVARVSDLADVVALAGDRVYLHQLPQSPTYPAVLVSLVSEVPDYHLRGPVGYRRARVQVDVLARLASGTDPYTLAAELASAIDGDGGGRTATGLDGWIGAVGSPPVDVAAVFRVSRVSRWDPDELQVVTMSTDYMVWFRQ